MPTPKAPANQKTQGVEQLALLGNHGKSEEILPAALGGNPKGTVLAEVSIAGDDPQARPITIVFRVEVPSGVFATGGLVGVVEFGSGGFQPSTANIDLRNGQVVTVHGSYVRVKVLNFSLVPINMAAFVALHRAGETDPMIFQDFGSIAGLATSALSRVPLYAKSMQVFTDANATANVTVEFRDGVGVLYTADHVPPVLSPPIVPLISKVTDVDVVNNLAGAIASVFGFWRLQL